MNRLRLAKLLPLALLLAAPLQLSAQSSSDGPRQLSEADQAKIRESMTKGKQRRAQELREAEQMRQAEQARQQEAQRLAAIEAQRVAEEQAAAEQEEESPNSGGTGGAVLHGLETLQGELDKNQAERRRQQAFLDNLARQKAEADRQRERERQRETDAQQRAQAQLQAQQQAQVEQAQAQARAQQQSAQARSSAGAQASAASQPSAQQLAQEQRDRQLREAAAKERDRLAQQQQQQSAPPKPAGCTKVHPKFETAFDTVRGEAIGMAGARKKAGEYCSARTGDAGFSTSNEGCTANGPYILNCSVAGQCSGLMSVTCANSQ